MAQWLNKNFSTGVLAFLLSFVGFSQNEEVKPEYKDYKSKDEFYKFHKRAKIVSAWQINELKEGALVVRLRTNKKIIDALLANGNEQLAKEKLAETFIINKNIMMAYIRNFNFCKLYFIYSSSSDSLFKGKREGYFLDTNLKVDATISLKEKFYLIAERDYAYNSSIGFVTQDSAIKVKETGTPVREMGVVVKNKYGHQLKNPFPYYIKDRTFADFSIPGKAQAIGDGKTFIWVADSDMEGQKRFNGSGSNLKPFTLNLKKQNLYKTASVYVQEFNNNLNEFYRVSPKPEVQKLSPQIIPYLY